MKKEIIKKINNGAKTMYDIMDKITIENVHICLDISNNNKIIAIFENHDNEFSNEFKSKIKEETEKYIRCFLSILRELKDIIEDNSCLTNTSYGSLPTTIGDYTNSDYEYRVDLALNEDETNEFFSYCNKIFIKNDASLSV